MREQPPGRVIRLPRAVAAAVLILLFVLLVVGIPLAGSWLASNSSETSRLSFFGVLLALFAALTFVLSAVVFRKARAVRRWSPVAATVIESEAVWGRTTRGGRTAWTWLPRLTYQYEVGGRVYQGRRIAFYKRRTGFGAQELVARHPVGSLVQVHYDPARPEEAVLDPSFPARWLLPFFAVVLAALSVVFFKVL
ncbi:MAG TPA: DUF3592 domain-containing protein [Pyrinomonadaceae bacterium]|nr:DUF3592 domain-containing protein [Pyrinomonadaceae bacterium]